MLGLMIVISLFSGPDCLSAGVEAARAKRWDDAFRAFRAARARPGCDTPPLLFNLARAGEKVVDGGDPGLACEVAEGYAEFMNTQPASALAKLAIEGRAKMARVCAAQPLPPVGTDEPGPVNDAINDSVRVDDAAQVKRAPSHALEWGLTTGAIVSAIGAGATYYLALGRIDERDAAITRFTAADARGDFAAAADAELDHDSHRDAAKALGITSYALGGAAVVLTGCAIWAWAVEDEPTSGAIIAPGFVGWGGRF